MRWGFTLTEVMLAVFMFTVLAAAMLGIFQAASRLYQQGEASLAAAEEATALLGLLRKDCERAVGPSAGGAWYSWIAGDGDCVAGWVIRNPSANRWHADTNQADRRQAQGQPPSRVFVLWGRKQTGQLYRLALPWPLLDSDATYLIEADQDGDPIDPRPLFDRPEAVIMSHQCLHLGVWLAGFTVLDTNGEPLQDLALVPARISKLGGSTAPTTETTWQYMRLGGNQHPPQPAEPSQRYRRYQTIAHWELTSGQKIEPVYPTAVRFSLVLPARPDDPPGKLVRITEDSYGLDNRIDVRGISGFIPAPGSVLLIGSDPAQREWVGIHGRDDLGFVVNSAWRHGPVALDATDEPTGWGILRCLVPSDPHEAGEDVIPGKLYQSTYRFGW